MENFSLNRLSVWQETPTQPAIGTVVHCHGLGEHSERHRNTFQKLLANGFNVFRFDFRGCGESKGERQWIDDFADYVEDARSVVAEARKRAPNLPIFLMGHSLGGAVALTLVGKGEGTVSGLVLSAPAYQVGKGVSPLKIKIGKLLEKWLPHLKIPGSLDLSTLSRDPKVVEAYKCDPLCCTYNTVKQGNEILKALSHLPEAVGRVKVPLLIAHGDHDKLIPVEGSRELFRKAPSSDKLLKEFHGGYHELHNDVIHDEYLNYVSGWLKARSSLRA